MGHKQKFDPASLWVRFNSETGQSQAIAVKSALAGKSDHASLDSFDSWGNVAMPAKS